MKVYSRQKHTARFRILIIIIFFGIILNGNYIEVNAKTQGYQEESSLYKTLYEEEGMKVEENDLISKLKNKIFILNLTIILMFVGIVIVLYIKNQKTKKTNLEISNFNILRKTFIDSYHQQIYLKDENLKYIFVNQSLCRLYNKTEGEIIGKDNRELFDRELADRDRNTDLQVLDKKTILVDEFTRSSEVYKTTKFPVELMNGAYGVGAYIENVTKTYIGKRKIEKNLKRNEILVDVLSKDFVTTQDHFDYVLKEILKLTESKFGYIFLYEEITREFTLKSWSKEVTAECKMVNQLMKYKLENVGLWGEVVRQRKPIIVNKYEKPSDLKRGYPKDHVPLKKFMSIPVMVDKKIVAVVGLANKKEDYDRNDIYQTTALMKGIWNGKERREAIADLTIERNKFLQTIISIGDGVLVVDLEGRITMLNKVAEQLSGWFIKEAKGRHYSDILALTHDNKTSKVIDPIKEVLNTDLDVPCDPNKNTVLISRYGTRHHIEEVASPIKDNKKETIGVVLVFRDVTEKIERDRKAKYLNAHDPLTGLYNRMYFMEKLKQLDSSNNLPISIIVGDMNGLKLVNDIFGHSAGDLLLKKAGRVMKEICKKDEIVARVGGDEFVILIPKAQEEETKNIIANIKEQFSKENVKAINGSISMGYDMKRAESDDILQILNNADALMYLEKTLEREEAKKSTIKRITEAFHKENPKEKEGSRNISQTCVKIGMELGLTKGELRRLKEAGYLRDIGKIALTSSANSNEPLTDQEQNELMQHPIIGYRIMNSFDNTLDLAEIVLSHHEKWDGSGYPKGLQGEEIPLLSRIIAIAESYEEIKENYNGEIISKDFIIKEMNKESGIKLDPKIVEVFTKII